jgi:two-component system alkaline phosphatase synthesis response regulator PhoP
MSNPLALIIEDDENLADIFSLALRRAQFEVEIVGEGKTALARLAETVPAVVVLDLHLPHVPGETILEQIRADSRLAHTRVILATADAFMAGELREAADLVLLKPISPSQLRELASRLRPLDTMRLE